MSHLVCSSPKRRELLQRNRRLNGLDYLDVSEDQRVLTVYLMDKTPVSVSAQQVIIEGGRKTTHIQVTAVEVHESEQLEDDDYLEVTVDKPGDFSGYTLRLIASADENPHQPHPDFDPYYSAIDFNFKVNCPNDLDCLPEVSCPVPERREPDLNYLARDYASFRQLLLDRLALVMPDWRERHVPDLGIALVEILAYVGDHLSYFQDAVATEAYLETARLRTSVRRHARLVDYVMHEGCNARSWVVIETGNEYQLDPALLYFITRMEQQGLPADLVLDEPALEDAVQPYLVFEPVRACTIHLRPSHDVLRFYTWGQEECCLTTGATEATLIGELADSCPEDRKGPGDGGQEDNDQDGDGQYEDPVSSPDAPEVQGQGQGQGQGQEMMVYEAEEGPPILYLKPGDVLVFEEVIGPETGNESDADPQRRHAVRLTAVESGFDPLTGTALVHIRWAACDALPFPFCLSAIVPRLDCALVRDISIARGNVVLVSHGISAVSDLGEVGEVETDPCCVGEGIPGDISRTPARFQPKLGKYPLTFSQPVPEPWCASDIVEQDPRRALPAISLLETSANGQEHAWQSVQDLLHARWEDRSFVVETDDAGIAGLRFGDGRSGQRPPAGSRFRARYRVGNGRAGNVGAESIAHLVLREGNLPTGITSIRNPLPASGGVDPEPIEEVKLFAPHAFSARQQRAITAEDYAQLVEREFPGEVQRAAALIEHRHCVDRVIVAVDPLGIEVAPAELLSNVRTRLERYRRIGHELSVRSACLVPLDVQLQVCVEPGYLRAHVKQALLDLFSNRRLKDGAMGLFHPDKRTFGEAVHVSRLTAAAQAVTGVESVAVTRLQRRFEPANGELDSGRLPLGPLEIARLDNDPSFPEHGRLELVMGGGR